MRTITLAIVAALVLPAPAWACGMRTISKAPALAELMEEVDEEDKKESAEALADVELPADILDADADEADADEAEASADTPNS